MVIELKVKEMQAAIEYWYTYDEDAPHAGAIEAIQIKVSENGGIVARIRIEETEKEGE